MTRSSPSHSPDSRSLESSARLGILQELLLDRFGEYLDHLGVSLKEDRLSWTGPCPIHGGRKPTALVLYKTEHARANPGKWMCFTRQCETTFRGTLLGFVRGVLSAQAGWVPGGEPISFGEVKRHVCEFLRVDPGDIRVDPVRREKHRFSREADEWQAATPILRPIDLTREQIRSKLQIPAEYFLRKQYLPGTLDLFDVGYCAIPDKDFSGRVVVPCYGAKGEVLGFTARATFPQCRECGSFHLGPCPPENDCWKFPKWLHSTGFQTRSCLYNWGAASRFLLERGKLIVVEGPGCVWRLHEAGVQAAATFGSALGDQQQVLLELTGVREVLVGYDNDEAGESGFQSIQRQLGRICRVRRLNPPEHDFGESSVQSIRGVLQKENLI